MHRSMRSFLFFAFSASFSLVNAAQLDSHRLNSRPSKPATGQRDADPFSFDIDGHAKFTFSQGGSAWLQSAPAFLYTEGKRFSAEDGSLKLDHQATESGADKMGTWTSQCFVYMAGSRSWKLCAKTWSSPAWPLVVFQQHYMNGTDGSAHDTDSVISGFPSFQIPTSDIGLGYFSYQGGQFGYKNLTYGKWIQGGGTLSGGAVGGPVTVFDQKGGACIMAPFSEFMSTSRELDSKGRVNWGVMGGVVSVPQGFIQQTAVYCGNAGINQVFSDWGTFMRTYYDKTDVYRKADLSIHYLGYYTDAGAYYYVKPEPNKTYEQTILDLKAFADLLGIPFRYIQYDAWFYPKGPPDSRGTMTWSATSDIAPDGLQYVYNITKWPVVAHNMWWSSKTPYAKANGGKYNFIVEKQKAIPQDLTFWMDLFNQARLWGVSVYEQDFLDVEFGTMNATQSTVDVAKTWLMQMGQAARATGLTIQYCMSNPRHAMQSLEIPAVTHARVSVDYRPGLDQWQIGVTSILAHALGLAPWKDNFWTVTEQPGNTYNMSEPDPELKAVVSTLSTGPVGSSDMLQHTNVSLLMQCCRVDGLILKPSKPATAIDKQLWQSVWNNGLGPSGQVWTTYSHVGHDWYFGIILAAGLTDDFKLSPSDAGFQFFNPTKVLRRPGQGVPDPLLADFGDNSPLTLTSRCTVHDFCMYYTSPVFTVGTEETQIIIYGEESKFVPMSRDRVSNIEVTGDGVYVTFQGTRMETIIFTYLFNGATVRRFLMFDNSGMATLSLEAPPPMSVRTFV
ncbi:uncharacterized protein [Littorina saxatilis]|uniref:Uncharacterized protein n=1 Tax=Littorina saxatilis TaxID=31220 RepID=A0AAN9B4N2_9CAEN